MSFKIITEDTPFLTPLESALLQQIKRQGGTSNFKVTKTYYKFVGKTFDEAYKNMKIAAAKVIKSKTVSGEQPIGHTDLAINYPKYKFRYGGSKNHIFVYPVGLIVQATAKVTLPQWVGVENTTEEDKTQWSELFSKLDKHEEIHVCIALTAFNQIKLEFLKVSGTGKNQTAAENDSKAKVIKVFNDINDETKAKQKKYDEDTDNGVKEAEQLEYNKLATQECDNKYPNN